MGYLKQEILKLLYVVHEVNILKLLWFWEYSCNAYAAGLQLIYMEHLFALFFYSCLKIIKLLVMVQHVLFFDVSLFVEVIYNILYYSSDYVSFSDFDVNITLVWNSCRKPIWLNNISLLNWPVWYAFFEWTGDSYEDSSFIL